MSSVQRPQQNGNQAPPEQKARQRRLRSTRKDTGNKVKRQVNPSDSLFPSSLKTSGVFDYATAKPQTEIEEDKEQLPRNTSDPFSTVPSLRPLELEEHKQELVLTKRSAVSNDSFENDPDRPANAINSTLIVEEIDINGMM